jgi:hypothetical protein
MAYNYQERTNELARILNISYVGVKVHALALFIAQEQQILRTLENPQNRSHVLDSAQRKFDFFNQPAAPQAEDSVAKRLQF